MLPATDGLFLGETLTPRRWDGSRLLNVLLSDGSRAMAGDLKSDTAFNRSLGTIGNEFLNVRARYFYAQSNSPTGSCSYYARKSTGALIIVISYNEGLNISYLGNALVKTILQGSTIFLKSNMVDMFDDATTGRYFRPGAVWASEGLPAAGESYRGKMILLLDDVGGGSDKFYCCMKAVDESYSWVEVATG